MKAALFEWLKTKTKEFFCDDLTNRWEHLDDPFMALLTAIWEKRLKSITSLDKLLEQVIDLQIRGQWECRSKIDQFTYFLSSAWVFSRSLLSCVWLSSIDDSIS